MVSIIYLILFLTCSSIPSSGLCPRLLPMLPMLALHVAAVASENEKKIAFLISTIICYTVSHTLRLIRLIMITVFKLMISELLC